ncbi:MAG: hypothetical protein DRI92_03720 [Aquificota bacterium]|nr:MAG: hypothetical protein DRI92_03720 [Aquificota bacterium]
MVERRKTALMLLVLVATASFVFAYKLGSNSYWLDEMITLYRTQRGWKMHYHAWPPFYFWLVWIWAKLFGVSEVALRSFSVLWGVLAVLATFYLGSLFSLELGFFASIFLIFNQNMVRYAQEARGYTMLLALSALSVILFVRMLEGRARKKEWCILALINILGTITHYAFILFMFSEYLVAFTYTLISKKASEKSPMGELLWSLGVWMAFMAVYLVIVHKALFGNRPVMSPRLGTIGVLTLMVSLVAASLWQKVILLGLLASSVILALADHQWRKWVVIVVSITGLFLVLVAIRSLTGQPMWKVRYLLPVLPLACLLMAYPLSKLSFHRSLLLAAVWVVITGHHLMTGYYSKPFKASWREAASWIKDHHHGELVVVNWYKYYRRYYLNCEIEHMRCIDAKKFLKMVKRGKMDLSEVQGIWLLLPQGGKWRWDKEIDALLRDKGFRVNREEIVGIRSRVIHFLRMREERPVESEGFLYRLLHAEKGRPSFREES